MATYPSNLINQGGGQANPSVAPGTLRPVLGTVAVPAGVTIGANDTFPLFYMSGKVAGHICSFFLDGPALDSGATLTVSLTDSLATPTVIINASTVFRAGGILTDSLALPGTMAAAIGYQAPCLIFLKAIAGAGAAVVAGGKVINFVFNISSD